jgi:hypothetical protein
MEGKQDTNSNHTKSEGIVSIDANGVLSNAVPVNLNATSQWKIILYIRRTVNTL